MNFLILILVVIGFQEILSFENIGISKGEDIDQTSVGSSASNTDITATTNANDVDKYSTGVINDVSEETTGIFTHLEESTLKQLDSNEVTKAFTTAGSTEVPDIIKQNILRMFINLLKPEIHDEKVEPTINDKTKHKIVTTPMTTPRDDNVATTKTENTQDILETSIKTIEMTSEAEDITEEQISIRPTFDNMMNNSLDTETIDIKTTTDRTEAIKEENTITTHIVNTMNEIHDITTHINYLQTNTMDDIHEQTTHASAYDQHTNIMNKADEDTTHTTKFNADELKNTTEHTAITTSNSIDTEEHATYKSKLIIQTTIAPTVITTITEPTRDTTEEVTSDAEEMTTEISTIKVEKEVSSHTIIEDKLVKQEEITTDWFYPTTTDIIHLYKLPQQTKEKVTPKVLPKEPKANTNFPWIFPQWISRQKLPNPPQNPRQIH